MMRFIFSVLCVFLIGCSKDADPTCQELGNCGVGDSCLADSECASERCIGALEDASLTRGQCAQPCEESADCQEGTCLVFPHPERVATTVCATVELGYFEIGDPCEADHSCAGGLCIQGTCTRPCALSEASPDTCPPWTKCAMTTYQEGVEFGTCRYNLGAPNLILGPFEVDEDGTQILTFDVPNNTRSIFLTLRTDHGTEFSPRVGFKSMVAPNGTVLFDLETAANINPAAIRYPQTSVFMAPISDDPRARPLPGTYTFRAGIWEVDPLAEVPFTPTTGRIEAVEITFLLEADQGGLVDLVIHTSPATGLELAQDSEFVQRLVQEVEAFFGASPLVVADVSFATVDESADRIGSSDEVRELISAHSVPGRRGVAVNVFVVEDISFASGFAATSPSPHALYGYGSSGIVVQHDGNNERTIRVIAHELGHFFGLSHTTDFRTVGNSVEVAAHDPISDTEMCEAPPTNMCPDRDNLMFPNIDFGRELHVTPAQAEVVSWHPSLFEFRRPDLCDEETVDITHTWAAAGFLRGQVAGPGCGEAGATRVHVLRVFEPIALDIEAHGDVAGLSIRDSDCTSDDLLCSAAEDGSAMISHTFEPGQYFVVVSGADQKPVQLRVWPARVANE